MKYLKFELGFLGEVYFWLTFMKKKLLTSSPTKAITLDPRLTIQDLELISSKIHPLEDKSMLDAVLERLAFLVRRDVLSKKDFKTADRIISLLKNFEKYELCVSVQEKYIAIKSLIKTFSFDDKFLDQTCSIVNKQIGEIDPNIKTKFISEKSQLLHSIKNTLEYVIERHHVVNATLPIRDRVIKVTITPIDSLQKIYERVENLLGEPLSEIKLSSFGVDIVSVFEQGLEAAKMNNSNIMFILDDNLFSVRPIDTVEGLITSYQAKVNPIIDLNRTIVLRNTLQQAA